MNKIKWIYASDYNETGSLIAECKKWCAEGYRVFVQGYSAMDCYEFVDHPVPPSQDQTKGDDVS